MTENEVLKDLKKYQGILKAKVRINASVNPEIALDSTTEAIELIEQYRAIGTVEELKTAMKYVSLAKKHGTVGKAIDACAEYESIGTIEEFKALKVENMTENKVNKMGDLISRQALLNAMDKRYNEKKDIIPDNLAEGFMQMEKLIKEQPTAYDVEKVEEALKNHPNVFQEMHYHYIPLENAVEVVQSNDGKGWWNE